MSANATSAAPRAAAWRLDLPNTSHPAESAILPDDGRQVGQESIIGQDERVLVDIADIQEGGKYRSVVKIQSRFENPKTGKEVWMMGTGWLIRPDLLITAGHVVYDWGYRLGAATQIKCYIGYNGRNSLQSPQTQARYGLNVLTTAEWIDGPNNRPRDVAFIQVDRPFTGALRTFNFINTPSPATRMNLGVVGYPGDKSLKDSSGEEAGAQMYEQFTFLDYDLTTSPRHMIEYAVSTFGGQSGAPILRKLDGVLTSIGTHCYGGGGDQSNSGNPIMGQYGNNYEAFIRLFNADKSTFKAPGSVQLVETQKRSTSTSLPTIQVANGGQEEGLLDALKSVAGITSSILPFASSLFGPVGSIVGTAAGGILGSFAGAESSIDVDHDGSAERAVLAEAALQAVLSMQESPELNEVTDKMAEIWSKNNTNVDGLVKAITPSLVNYAQRLTPHANKISQGSGSATLPYRRPLTVRGPESSGEGSAFTEGLFGPTKPIAGEEGLIDFAGPLLRQALGAATPIVSDLASNGIKFAVGKLAGLFGGSESAIEPTSDEQATRLLLKRSMMADTALQALMTLPKDKLHRITLQGSDQAEGAIFDFIKTKVQQYGPTVLNAAKDVAKDVARKYLPSLIAAGTTKLNSALNNALGLNPESAAGAVGGAPTPGTLNKKPSLMDMLNRNTNPIQVVA